jgi:F-type H+-transporting ATPase subunit a
MTAFTGLGILAANPIEKVVDHVQIGEASGFSVVTNHMILMAISALILVVVMPLVAGAYKRTLVPSGFSGFIETIISYLRDSVVRPVVGDDTDSFMPFLLTIFSFVLVNNLLGLMPLYELTYWLKSLGWLPHPIYGTATGNLAVTGVLALCSFVVIQMYAFQQNGVGGYLKHLTAGAPVYMWPIMVPVEIIGMIVKPFALMMRLFANMLAGGIVLKVLVGFVGMASAIGIGGIIGIGIPVVIGSALMMVLKLFVAFLQAYLFMFLTSIFISQWAHHHDDHHEEGHAHAH